MAKRVVITGMDTINPLGDNLEEYYANLIAGKSGIKKWESLKVDGLSCRIGGDIGDYDMKAALEGLKGWLGDERFKKIRRLFKKMTFPNKSAVLTSLKAWKHSGLNIENLDPFRVSVMAAGHNFNSKYIMEQTLQFVEEPAWIDPLYGVEALDPNIPGTISEVLGAKGPAFTLGAACASGNLAIRDGFRDIMSGECDVSVASGAIWDMNESDLNAMAYLDALVVAPEFQDKPEQGSRPFDSKRCGFVPSHGSATIILEDLEHAKARGATIIAEVLAVAANSNANHLPAPSQESQTWLMKTVLERSGLKPEDIDYVNCHATGTPLGDIKELSAIKEALGEHAKKIKLNAPKSMLGHTCWAAPLVEMIGGILQMQHGKLHGTINIDELAPEVDLDVCKDGAVEYPAKVMLKNAFGFGGLNCCSLIRLYEE